MVLRGSSISPPSLIEAEHKLKEAEAHLLRAREDLENTKKAAFMMLDDDTVSSLSRDELVSLVKRLRSRVDGLEYLERKAQGELLQSQIDLRQTLTSFACGGAAGAVARTFVAPMDRIKILMQTSYVYGAETKYRSVLGTAQRIVAEEGVNRLWRGNLTNCVRVVPHTAIQFGTYEKFKSIAMAQCDETEQLSVRMRLLGGAVSGMTAASFTHPMDVVRIRLQTQPELRGIADAFRSVNAENGIRSFYKGYIPAMISLSPFIAVNFATFDTLKNLYFGGERLTKKEMQARNPFAILSLGATAGIIAQTCCYPLDTIRRRMQLAGTHYGGVVHAFQTVFRNEGFGGFYKGMTANTLKVVPNNAIRFAAYELLKAYFITDEENIRMNTWGSSSQAKAVSKTSSPL